VRSAALLVGLVCLGCQVQTIKWSYTPEPRKTRAPLIARSVAVPPAIDQRADDNVDWVAFDIYPLVPYGWYAYTRPEKETALPMIGNMRCFRPDEDIAVAVAAELQASGLFDEVFYASHAPKGTLELSVTIESTLAEGKVNTYGLSMAGPVLWLVGLPSGSISSELKLAFELKEQATGRSLWSARSERLIDERFYGVYSPSPGFQFDAMLKDMLVNEVLPALERLPPTP